ncbi:MAG: serpin family protein [bacterium]
MPNRIFLSLIMVGGILFAMGSRAQSPEPANADMKSIVRGNNQFCFNLYQNLAQKVTGNIFYSPFSITMAMGMVYEGARGWAAREMEEVFQFPIDAKARQEAFYELYKYLNKKNARYKLSIANGLWVQKDYVLLDTYLKIIERYYDGKATNLDFVGSAENARQTINKWVEQKTNNKIKDLLPSGSIKPTTRLIITNAIYFKGIWIKQFDKNLTREDDFWVNETETVKVPMMRRTDPGAIFNYAETEGVQILELCYEGDDLSMLIFLPRDKTLDKLENGLSAEKLEEWKNALSERRVEVYIPRFTFTTRYDLTISLSELGMPNAFAPHCDLSGIDGTKNLYIQSVVHQAYVDVNEEGTEAAAATGVVVGITSVGPQTPVFRADHPFVFIIQERSTGNILFIGKVVKPEI